jgi:hypothetical protein
MENPQVSVIYLSTSGYYCSAYSVKEIASLHRTLEEAKSRCPYAEVNLYTGSGYGHIKKAPTPIYSPNSNYFNIQPIILHNFNGNTFYRIRVDRTVSETEHVDNIDWVQYAGSVEEVKKIALSLSWANDFNSEIKNWDGTKELVVYVEKPLWKSFQAWPQVI